MSLILDTSNSSLSPYDRITKHIRRYDDDILQGFNDLTDRIQGYYDTMDVGYKDEFGYVYVMARDDDVINVAGHRLSTSALEDVVLAHPDIVDAAVVGVPDPTKGEIPLCLYIMKEGEDFGLEKCLYRANNLVDNTMYLSL